MSAIEGYYTELKLKEAVEKAQKEISILENSEKCEKCIGNKYKSMLESFKNAPLVVTAPQPIEIHTYEQLKNKCKDQEKEIIKLKNVIKNLCE